jgi:hypothetical protein
VIWQDLTVENADEVRDFYASVVGWRFAPERMGDYSDYNMIAPGTGRTVAGICHARGVNADLPPQWLVYVAVDDVDRSAAACREHGGEVLVAPRLMGGGRLCVIRDPAGAVLALYEQVD